MSQIDALQTTFASGRYSKRKRTQVNYRMEELDVDTDMETEDDMVQPKKQRKTATASKPLPKRKIFPFLELPAEIRNIIYTYALTDPSGFNFVAVQRNRRRCVERVTLKTLSEASEYRGCYQSNRINDRVSDENGFPTALVPSLLAVNKQIHREGSGILYGNELVFADTLALYAFMINLGPASALHLRRIRLMGWGYGRGTKAYNNACFAAMVWATNLEKLVIDTSAGRYGEPKSVARQIYRDAFPWLEAVGNAKGRFNAALDVLDMDEECLEWRFSQINSQSPTVEEMFYAELSRILESQQKRVMAKSKKRKIQKVNDYS